jgi:hypothetical protein
MSIALEHRQLAFVYWAGDKDVSRGLRQTLTAKETQQQHRKRPKRGQAHGYTTPSNV